MPKRIDLHKILIIGSGPIVIGQGCEFDYSGVQACKALKKEGYEIVLVNSNPATIMTDPDMADHTYIEAINWQTLAKIIAKEKPDAILSTMGGQTALNSALELDKHGVLRQHNVELIGACRAAIEKAEDREKFSIAMQNLGLEMARSYVAKSMADAMHAQQNLGFPVIIRPSYTLGGSGGGVAYNAEQFEKICEQGFKLSLNHQLLIEESLLGWKEYELEVIRDANDSCIIVCTIENIDPMGIHTGDSITVAPAQTLTDKEYQVMRNAAIAILREIGVQTGGSNVQFAVHPQTGRMVVIEMNPRVSRSSALASKATGFPIAKVAALLAVGYTLDELQNDITGGAIPASFEPTLDYVVVKIPRFNFDKFPQITPQLTTQMQAIGEVMAIGSTFAAALQKALCSLEIDLFGFEPQLSAQEANARLVITHELQHVGPLRLLFVADAFRVGMTLQEIYALTNIDPWFLDQIQTIINIESSIKERELRNLRVQDLLFWKQQGFADRRIADLMGHTEKQILDLRTQLQIIPKFKRIDSCAAEFPASTAYLYSTYDGICEAEVTNRKKVIVLGSGPNRIGQGIEFDYCCVQAVQALQEAGIEAIMINCNPETVSTDYDISDRLYFDALTLESVLEIVRLEQPLGVILQLGGQTPLKLAHGLQNHGVRILGSSPDIIDLAEDRGSFAKIIHKLGLKQPANAMASNVTEGLAAAQKLQYPLILRPSYVLGGRSMRIVHNDADLCEYIERAFYTSNDAPILIDSYLQDAIEVDVDLIADGQGGVFISGIMQHIEPAGVHSGDSAACLPPHTLSGKLQDEIKQQAHSLALELQINGLMNIQFAVQGTQIFILEVNPRASRTVPFVSKSIGCAVTKIAVNCMLGKSLQQQKLPEAVTHNLFAVKQSVFPFNKFLGADPILGPEMRSTGEIMAFGETFAQAYAKGLQAANVPQLPEKLNVYLSVAPSDYVSTLNLAKHLLSAKHSIMTDLVTGSMLLQHGVECTVLLDNLAPLKLLTDGEINLVVSTLLDLREQQIRILAIRYRTVCITTIASAQAMLLAHGIDQAQAVYKLQDLTEKLVSQTHL